MSQARGFETAIQEAGDAGLQCVQVFSRNPVGGQSRSLPAADSLKPLMDQSGVTQLLVHAPYFVNPASLDPMKALNAQRVLSQEMRRAKRLSANAVVLHPGHGQASTQRSEVQTALIATVTAMLKGPGRILLENTAGQGHEIGADLVELGELFRTLGKSRRVGLIFDTAHAMAFGYPLVSSHDVDTLLDQVDQHIGLERLVALHLNDSYYGVGSRRDRHAHLLAGALGKEALVRWINYADRHHWLLILETPGKDISSRLEDIALIRECSIGLGNNAWSVRD